MRDLWQEVGDDLQAYKVVVVSCVAFDINGELGYGIARMVRRNKRTPSLMPLTRRNFFGQLNCMHNLIGAFLDGALNRQFSLAPRDRVEITMSMIR
jgi:hypothetical protein